MARSGHPAVRYVRYRGKADMPKQAKSRIDPSGHDLYSEADFGLYQSTRLSRYDAIS